MTRWLEKLWTRWFEPPIDQWEEIRLLTVAFQLYPHAFAIFPAKQRGTRRHCGRQLIRLVVQHSSGRCTRLWACPKCGYIGAGPPRPK